MLNCFRLITLLALLLASGLPTRALADEIPADKAVEAGRDALRGKTKYPWYDAEKDSVKRINFAPPKTDELPNRRSRWSSSSSGNGSTTTAPTISAIGPILQVIGISLLIALLVAIAVLIARAALRNESAGTLGSQIVETSRDVDRVENLPFNLKRPTGDFLSEARRLYEAGQYSEAIVYYFSYQLVELDKHHAIRLAKGKTNRQYARELRHRPQLRSLLEMTIVPFEDVFFGRHELDRERFEACWKSLDSFERELRQNEQAAA